MAEKTPSSSRTLKLRRMVKEERRLLQEKCALEQMLKNVQHLRTKLKVEQMQLCSHLQEELGSRYVEVPVQSIKPNPDPLDMEEEEANLQNNKPSLNLSLSDFPGMFPGREDDAEELEDDSEDEIGCANEVLENFNETEINFDDF